MKQARQSESTALQAFEPAPEDLYPIDAVVRITQTPRHRIAVYYLHGLVSPVTRPDREGWWFDQEAIRVLRRIECLRVDYGMNLEGLRIMADLFREVERLREEVRALRRA